MKIYCQDQVEAFRKDFSMSYTGRPGTRLPIVHIGYWIKLKYSG
jgi:hypothetical protein